MTQEQEQESSYESVSGMGGYTNRLSEVEYSDPKHYDGELATQTRTAWNVTNLDAEALESRIGEASGIATTEQLI